MAENNNFHDNFQSCGQDEEEIGSRSGSDGSGKAAPGRGVTEESYKLSYRKEVRGEMGTVVEDTGTGEVVTALSNIQANGARDRETRSRATVV